MKKVDWTKPLRDTRGRSATYAGTYGDGRFCYIVVIEGKRRFVDDFGYGENAANVAKQQRVVRNVPEPKAKKGDGPITPMWTAINAMRDEMGAMRQALEEIKAAVGPYRPSQWTPPPKVVTAGRSGLGS
jgi:hypothetical protein